MRQLDTNIEIAYEGPSVESGTIELGVLADGLRGMARLTNRVSFLMYGEAGEYDLLLESSFRRGSIIVPLDLVRRITTGAEQFLVGEPLTALSNLMGLIGFVTIVKNSLFWLFKRKAGRPVEDGDISLLQEVSGEVDIRLLLLVYNDDEVRRAILLILKPLRQEGIAEFQTRRDGNVIERVTKADLASADEAETEALTSVEEVVLDVEKVALLPHLAWHFSDGASTFDAKVTDSKFLDNVLKGEQFGHGDRMHVILNTKAGKDKTGRLLVERTVTEVISVEHAREWRGSFWDDPRT